MEFLFLRNNWKAILVGAVFIAAFYAGWQVKAWKDEASKTTTLENSIKATATAEKNGNAILALSDTKIDDIGLNAARLADKWNEVSHEETDCPLSDNAIELLKSARSPSHSPSRSH